MTRKQVHDAAAYIRGLAQMRGRNADWAERAVREAVSLSASEALAQHVIDLTARDVPDLLRQARRPHASTRPRGDARLATAGAAIVTLEPDWRSRFLAVDHRSERRADSADDRHVRPVLRVRQSGLRAARRGRRDLPADRPVRAADAAGQLRRARR